MTSPLMCLLGECVPWPSPTKMVSSRDNAHSPAAPNDLLIQ